MKQSEYLNFVLNLIEDASFQGLDSGSKSKLEEAVKDGVIQSVPSHYIVKLRELLANVVLVNPLPVRLAKALGYSIKSDRDWVAALHQSLVFPSFLMACRLDDPTRALVLQWLIDNDYVRANEAESRFEDFYSVAAGLLSQSAERFKRSLPPVGPHQSLTDSQPNSGGISFILVNESMLAHVEMLIGHFTSLRKASLPETPPICVVSMYGQNKQLRSRLAELDVELVSLKSVGPPGARLLLDRILVLREYVAYRAFKTLIWVSVPIAMNFAYALRIAPTQIWYAMKYYAIESDHIDGYLTGGAIGPIKQVEGRRWTNISAYVENLVDWSKAEAGQALRSEEFGNYSQIMMTIGRTAKIESEPFLSAVCKVLQKFPDVGFLWTGKNQSAVVQSYFDQAGVSGQCHFIGWVDPLLYSHVTDIYLDTFPFPTGLTAMNAMAAGKPVVFYRTKQAIENGQAGHIISGLTNEDDQTRSEVTAMFSSSEDNNGDLFYLADDEAHYLELVGHLLQDSSRRQSVGEAGKRFVDTYLGDPERSARSLLDAIGSIENRSE